MNYTKRFDEISAGDVAVAGGKGANLGELTRAGLPVPAGFVVTTAAYDAFVAANDLTGRIIEIATRPASGDTGSVDPGLIDPGLIDTAAFDVAAEEIRGLFRAGEVPGEIERAIRSGYAELGHGEPVAVRSSATAEDLAGASFAGQQDTYLNVRGAAAVVAAVKDCWASLWTARAMAYRARQGIAPETVSLAVVIQQMVQAESSGVMFTANPANGRCTEAVISAAWGLGESVVSGSVSTDDHVIDKATGSLISRHTADKTVLTGYATVGTEQRPVPAAQRRTAVLDDPAVTALTALGARIENHYGAPQDIEWARAGGEFFIVQSRPITALPDPMADPPTRWPRPDPHGLYFRASIVEQMPDPLTPLFADLIDGSVTRSLRTLIGQAFSSDVLRAGDIGLPTINGYAYYYYRTSGLWRLMAKSVTGIRALAGRSSGGFHGGVTGWREHSHPRYAQLVETWTAKTPGDLTSQDLLEGVSQLLDAGTEYYTAVQSIIPLAATSEIGFRSFYDRFVRRAGEPPAHTLLLGFDSEPIRAEKSLYDLAMAARQDPQLAAALSHATAQTLGGDAVPAGVDPQRWQQWCAQFQHHLDRYGHTVYNLDFANPVPADDPAPLLDTVRFYLSGQGSDPHQRQQRSAERREAQTRVARARLDPLRRAVFDRLLRWAQHTGPIREDALADMGLAWPPMRRMLLELGRQLAETGTIAEPADVFWLRYAELRGAISTGAPWPDLPGAIEQRKMLWRGQRQATAPQLLPETGWLMRLFATMMPAASQQQSGATITGVGASSGQVTARARVLDGPADFSRLQPGEVLVARITTPAWTSLFAMASAVVTDVGGPLSHSSIVAREYGIPAVLGTGAATGRIRSGQTIRVDGDAGTVTIVQ